MGIIRWVSLTRRRVRVSWNRKSSVMFRVVMVR